MKTTIYKCPECETPGANVAIWGSAALTPCGKFFDGDMEDMNYDPGEPHKCLDPDCDFEGDSGDFKHEVEAERTEEIGLNGFEIKGEPRYPQCSDCANDAGFAVWPPGGDEPTFYCMSCDALRDQKP